MALNTIAQGATAGATIVSTKCRVKAIVLTPAAAVTTAVLKDNTTVVMSLQAAANGQSVVVNLPDGLAFGTNLTVVVTGASGILHVSL